MGIDGGYEGWFLCLECHLRTRFTSKNLSFEFSANLCKSVQIVLKAIRLKSQWNTSKTPTCDSQCWQCVSRVSRFGAKNPSLGKAEKSVSHELQPQQFLLQILQSWNFGTFCLRKALIHDDTPVNFISCQLYSHLCMIYMIYDHQWITRPKDVAPKPSVPAEDSTDSRHRLQRLG